MKRLIVVLAMMAGSVFLAAPASATDGDTPPPDPALVAPAIEEPAPAPAEEPAPAPAEDPVADNTAKSSAVTIQVADPKVVVCKFVSTPGGDLFNIIIVSASSLDGDGFDGTFPFTFGDAQDSTAIRFAEEAEQAKDLDVAECDDVPPPPPPPDDDPKVVVCKFVSTPGGFLFNVIIVSASSLDGDGFDGTFPFTFGDAQDSIAIRFAEEGEQAKDIDVAECQPDIVAEVTAEEPTVTPATCDDDGTLNVPTSDETITYTVDPEFDGPGDYTVTAEAADGFTLIGGPTFEVTVEGQLPASECIKPAGGETDDEAVLPDTGGAPLWILPLGGALAAGGVMFLRGARRPVAIGGSWGGDTGFSLAMPPMLKDAPVRAAVSADAKSEWLMLAGGVAAVVAALFFGSRLR